MVASVPMPTVLLLLVLVPGVATAQRAWLDASDGGAVEGSVTTAVFDDGVTDPPVVLVDLGIRLGIGNDLVLVASLAGGRAAQRSGARGTAVGNPWIGIEFRPGTRLAFELGAWPSLWSPGDQETALPWVYGQLLEHDRRERWLPRTSAVRASGQFEAGAGPGPFATVRLGFSGIAPRGMGIDGELFAVYAARLGQRGDGWRAWLGVHGRAIVTESGIGFGERTSHQVELGLELGRGDRRAGLMLRRGIGEPFSGNVPLIIRAQLVAAW